MVDEIAKNHIPVETLRNDRVPKRYKGTLNVLDKISGAN